MLKYQKLESNWSDPIQEKRPKPPAILPLVRFGFQTLGRLFPKAASDLAFNLFATPFSRAKHRVSDPILESARIFEVLYGKRMLKCYEWGQGEKTILFVHGWESRGTALRSFVPILLEQGFRVVAFDGPAHGNSEGKRTTLPHFAGAVRAVINQIGGAYGIIAHSFGGATTVFAMSWLDKTIHVEKLVMIAVPSSIKRIYKDAVKTMGLPPKVAAGLRRKMEKIVGQSLDVIDSPETFHRISVPEVLIVHDVKDSLVSFDHAKALAKEWDAATFLETSGYGHFRLMKNPDLVKAVGTFLA